jgi:chromatin segregation and condensation protein Rec8/ScpA/Scc1 (kleisin family)
MVIAQDLGEAILEMVEQRRECDMEELTSHCPQATWNQVFLALDKLSREGQVALRQQGPGRYKVGLASQRRIESQVSSQHHA